MGKILESIAQMLSEEQKAAQDKILGKLPDYPSYLSALSKLEAIKMIDYKIHEIIDTYLRAQDSDY
jgi:hypothetical protein